MPLEWPGKPDGVAFISHCTIFKLVRECPGHSNRYMNGYLLAIWNKWKCLKYLTRTHVVERPTERSATTSEDDTGLTTEGGYRSPSVVPVPSMCYITVWYTNLQSLNHSDQTAVYRSEVYGVSNVHRLVHCQYTVNEAWFSFSKIYCSMHFGFHAPSDSQYCRFYLQMDGTGSGIVLGTVLLRGPA